MSDEPMLPPNAETLARVVHERLRQRGKRLLPWMDEPSILRDSTRDRVREAALAIAVWLRETDMSWEDWATAVEEAMGDCKK